MAGLPDDSPKALTIAALLGAASSSCWYAAVTLAWFAVPSSGELAFQIIQHFRILVASDFSSSISLSNNLFRARSGLIVTLSRPVIQTPTQLVERLPRS